MYCCTFTDVQLVCSWEKSLGLVNCSVLNKAQIHQEILSQLSLWLLLPAQFNGQKPGIFVKLTDFSHPLWTSPWKLSFLGSNFLWCNPAVWPDNHLEKRAVLMCLGLELNSCKKEKTFPVLLSLTERNQHSGWKSWTATLVISLHRASVAQPVGTWEQALCSSKEAPFHKLLPSEKLSFGFAISNKSNSPKYKKVSQMPLFLPGR